MIDMITLHINDRKSKKFTNSFFYFIFKTLIPYRFPRDLYM